jgi:hypothetical protein
MSQFLAAAWAIHPDFILNEVGCTVLELVEPFVEGQLLLFICASDLIHAKCDTLDFRTLVRILEIHDFSSSKDSSDDGADFISSDSSDSDGLPGSGGGGSLRPWPAIFRYTEGMSPSGQSWPSLPRHGGDVRWGQQAAAASHAFPTCGTDSVASQNGKAAALLKMANGSRLFRAQASRRRGKVTEKARGRTMPHIHRLPPIATGEESTHMMDPEVKFKKCWVRKTTEAHSSPQLGSPAPEHQRLEAGPLGGGGR